MEFGGAGHTHVSAPQGVVVYADEASDPRFSKMQWAAACSDTRVIRPCLIWSREDTQAASILASKLQDQVARLKARVNHNRDEARKPGTPQWHLLKDINDEIARYNAQLPRGGRIGRKQRMTIERCFKYEVLEREGKKGGLDFVWYAFSAYQDASFPYYRQIRGLNPSKTVLICEDNVGVHHKARRLMADLIHEFDIKFIDTPANSPDLQPIEHLHKDQKDLLFDFRRHVTSAAGAVQLEAENRMKGIWQHNRDFDDQVKWRMSIDYFKGLADRAKNSTPKYGNRYKDSL